jgi:hypothetical protein
MERYGPAPTFLTTTGYEPVRGVAAAIAGEAEAAGPGRADATGHGRDTDGVSVGSCRAPAAPEPLAMVPPVTS